MATIQFVRGANVANGGSEPTLLNAALVIDGCFGSLSTPFYQKFALPQISP
jgi:hypothetical protein